jgi:hypothetical protein
MSEDKVIRAFQGFVSFCTVFIVSHGEPFEGQELDSVWLSREHAEARQKWLKEEYGHNRCYYIEECEVNDVRRPRMVEVCNDGRTYRTGMGQ